MKRDDAKTHIDWHLIFTLIAAVITAMVIVVTVSAIGTRDAETKTVLADVTKVSPEVVVPEVEENIPEETPEVVPEAPSAPVTDETIPVINPDELEMLACVIYQEAGGDGSCDECRRRVADVVLNRVNDERFPDTIYEVLTAPRQYGRFHWIGIVWGDRANTPGEKHAVERAYRIAEEVLSGQHSDLYGNGYIWQAEFVQGSEGFWCCGHYFGR